MKKLFFIIFIVIVISLISSGCALTEKQETSETDAGDALLEITEAEQASEVETTDLEATGDKGSTSITPFNSYPIVDGLHITGSPTEVDIEEYRLEVTGEVKNPLSLTYDQIKDMDSRRIYAELECPGFFLDVGYWTGIEVRYLLEKAIVSDTADKVSFISLDGYASMFSLEEVMENEGLLVAYYFYDKEFPAVHGYPLRIVAEGYPGSKWVKWLGSIEIIASGD